MTILSQIDALRAGLTNAYTAIEAKGGTVPANKNVVNLPDAVNSVPSGGGGGSSVSQYGAVYKAASAQLIIQTSQVEGCSPVITDWNKAYMTYLDARDPYGSGGMGVQFTYSENFEQGGYAWSVYFAGSGEQHYFTDAEMLSECGITVTGTEGEWCAFSLNVVESHGSASPLAKVEFANTGDFATLMSLLGDNSTNVYVCPLGNGVWTRTTDVFGVEVGPNVSSISSMGLSRLNGLYLIDLSGATSLTADSIQAYAFSGSGGMIPSGTTHTIKVGNIPATVASATAFNGISTSSGKWTCYGEKRAEWVAKFPSYLMDGGE